MNEPGAETATNRFSSGFCFHHFSECLFQVKDVFVALVRDCWTKRIRGIFLITFRAMKTGFFVVVRPTPQRRNGNEELKPHVTDNWNFEQTSRWLLLCIEHNRSIGPKALDALARKVTRTVKKNFRNQPELHNTITVILQTTAYAFMYFFVKNHFQLQFTSFLDVRLLLSHLWRSVNF